MTIRCEQLQRREQLRRLGLAVVLGAGTVPVSLVLVAILHGIYTELLKRPASPWELVDRKEEALNILPDGTPVVGLALSRSCIGMDYRNATCRTLDGKDIKLPKSRGCWCPSSELCTQEQNVFHKRLGWDSRVEYLDKVGREKWYFIHDGALHGYCVGYDERTKLRIGYIGRDGFQGAKPSFAAQFSIEEKHRHSPILSVSATNFEWVFWRSDYLVVDDGVMRIDLRERMAIPVWKGSGLVSHGVFRRPVYGETESDDNTFQEILVLRTSETVVLFNANGNEVRNRPLPAELQKLDLIYYDIPGDETLLGHRGDSFHDLYWVDASGTIVRREHVALERQEWPVEMTPNVDEIVGFGLGTASPGFIAGFFVMKDYDPIYGWRDYWAAIHKDLVKIRVAFLIAGVISVVLAVLCYRRQRKFALPGAWMWTIFVLLFGLPAYLGYRFHRRWPARLPCPSCGRRVPRDRVACCECSATFAAPALTGNEVFA